MIQGFDSMGSVRKECPKVDFQEIKRMSEVRLDEFINESR